MTGLTGHPCRAGQAVTGQGGHGQSADVGCMGEAHAAGAQFSSGVGEWGFGMELESGRSGAAGDVGATDKGDAGAGTLENQGVHYYVDVPHCEDTAYAACDRDVQTDTQFHHHLQQQSGTADISTFLALPEIIPPRERRRQQPLLDFMKSKILTSHAYTESCERVLAQKEASQAEAKWKAEIREATKETRRQEKEEKQVQVRARKEARVAKKLEK